MTPNFIDNANVISLVMLESCLLLRLSVWKYFKIFREILKINPKRDRAFLTSVILHNLCKLFAKFLIPCRIKISDYMENYLKKKVKYSVTFILPIVSTR